MATIFLGWLFTEFGFMIPVETDPWTEILAIFLVSSLTLTPLLIYLYFVKARALARTGSKAALAIIEILVYAAYLIIPTTSYPDSPAIVTSLFFLWPPTLAILAGLGLERVEPKSSRYRTPTDSNSTNGFLFPAARNEMQCLLSGS